MMEFSVRTPGSGGSRGHHGAGAGGPGPARRPDLQGVAYIFVPHTTAGVTINEGADPAVVKDILALWRGLCRATPAICTPKATRTHTSRRASWARHVAVPVSAGRLRLGTWQSIYLAEFDGPRTRRVRLQLMAQ